MTTSPIDTETRTYLEAQEELREFESAIKIAGLMRGFTCEQRKKIKARVYKVLSMPEE